MKSISRIHVWWYVNFFEPVFFLQFEKKEMEFCKKTQLIFAFMRVLCNMKILNLQLQFFS